MFASNLTFPDHLSFSYTSLPPPHNPHNSCACCCFSMRFLQIPFSFSKLFKDKSPIKMCLSATKLQCNNPPPSHLCQHQLKGCASFNRLYSNNTFPSLRYPFVLHKENRKLIKKVQRVHEQHGTKREKRGHLFRLL